MAIRTNGASNTALHDPAVSSTGHRSDSYIVFGAPRISEAAIAEVVDSLRTGWIGTGPKVARFEEMLAEYLGVGHAVAVSSCTAALHLSFLAHGIGPGDEVITTPMTFPATINSILHCGATPVLVDCVRDTGLIDPAGIERAITPRTRAVVPVHLAGRPCDMDAIERIAAHHGLLLIDDAAHALEAAWNGRKIGTVGSASCFSFYVTKNITTGEGGLLATDDPDVAARVRGASLHGLSHGAWQRYSAKGPQPYDVTALGYKYNMTDIQAAIGIHQLPRIDEWLRRREDIWARYDAAFDPLPVGTPCPPPAHCVHARHLYTLTVDEAECGLGRDAFRRELHDRGIGSGVHYTAVHLHTYYRERFAWRPEDLPNSTWLSERTVSLPLSPHLSENQVERVIAAVRAVVTPGPRTAGPSA